MTSNEKLEYFTSLILSDANTMSQQIMTDIQKEQEEEINRAQDEYLEKIYRHIRSEVSHIRAQEGQRVSKKVLECKRILHARRTEMEEGILAQLRQRILEFAQGEQYVAKLQALSREANVHLSYSPATVYLRRVDLCYADLLDDCFDHSDITFEEGDLELGGLIVVCPARHIRIDQSFDTAYAEKTAHIAELLNIDSKIQ